MAAIAEKERVKAEKKRIRDIEKAKAAEEKALLRAQAKYVGHLVDDEELEMRELAEQAQAAGVAEAAGAPPAAPAAPARPQFPPPEVGLVPAFPAGTVPPALQADVLMIWKFVNDFQAVIRVNPSVGELISALEEGDSSQLLVDLHVAMMKMLQADIEEAHGVVNSEEGMDHKGGQLTGLDRSVQWSATVLNEAWAWHFSNDVWRAHLNGQTWTEVLRQLAIAYSLGPERPKPAQKQAEAKRDEKKILEGENKDIDLEMPRGYTVGTLKYAAWQVLARVGPEGMDVFEIVKTIDKEGLRHAPAGKRTSKTPEASLSSALCREQFVFERLEQGRFALGAVVRWHKRKAAQAQLAEEARARGEEVPAEAPAKPAEAPAAAEESPEKAAPEAKAPAPREALEWVKRLGEDEYNALPLEHRVAALATLVQICLESPTVYQILDNRLFQRQETQKHQREEFKLKTKERKLEIQQKGLDAAPAADASEDPLTKLRWLHMETLYQMENLVRTPPLGLDRRFNRYFLFAEGKQPRQKLRLLVENDRTREWGLVPTKDGFQALYGALNKLGLREQALQAMLSHKAQQIQAQLTGEPYAAAAPAGEDDGGAGWLAKVKTESRKHLRNLGVQGLALEAMEGCPPGQARLQKLKADLLDFQRALPETVLRSKPKSRKRSAEFDGAVWATRVETAENAAGLRDCLQELEGALDTEEMHLDYCPMEPWIIPGAYAAGCGPPADWAPEEEDPEGAVGFPMAKGDLSWLPPTCGALSLRLATLDSAVVYDTHKKNAKAGCKKNQAYKYIQRDFYINDDGTNFTYVAPNGQLRTGALQMASMNFPAFPEVAISKPQVFGLPAKDFAEQLRTIGFFYDDGQEEEAAEEPIPPGKAGRARRASKRAKAIVESDEESEDSGDDFVMAEAAGNGAGETSDED